MSRKKHVVIVANRTQNTVERFAFPSKTAADGFRKEVFRIAREIGEDMACTTEDLLVTGKG